MITYGLTSASELRLGFRVALEDDEPTASWTVGEIVRSILRIERKLDKALDSHEQRISRLERIISILIGVSLGSAGGSVAAIVTSILG